MATQIYNTLGKVPRTAEPKGVYSLNMIVPVEGISGASAVTKLEVSYIKQIKISAPSTETLTLMQQAAGDNIAEYVSNPKWTGSIICYRGKAKVVLAQLLGIVTGSYYGLNSFLSSGLPAVHWEQVIRDVNNYTHIQTIIFEDMILMPSAWDNPIGAADFEIPFYCRRKFSFLDAGYEMVYNRLASSGSGLSYTLSATPVPIADSTLWDQQEFNRMFSLKIKATADSTGTIVQGAACSIAGTTITFTTAPVAGQLQALYPKAVTP